MKKAKRLIGKITNPSGKTHEGKHGWKINYINDCRIETNFHPEGEKGFLSSITLD